MLLGQINEVKYALGLNFGDGYRSTLLWADFSQSCGPVASEIQHWLSLLVSPSGGGKGIQTPSPAAFLASRTQIAADLARAVRAGMRGL